MFVGISKCAVCVGVYQCMYEYLYVCVLCILAWVSNSGTPLVVLLTRSAVTTLRPAPLSTCSMMYLHTYTLMHAYSRIHAHAFMWGLVTRSGNVRICNLGIMFIFEQRLAYIAAWCVCRGWIHSVLALRAKEPVLTCVTELWIFDDTHNCNLTHTYIHLPSYTHLHTPRYIHNFTHIPSYTHLHTF